MSKNCLWLNVWVAYEVFKGVIGGNLWARLHFCIFSTGPQRSDGIMENLDFMNTTFMKINMTPLREAFCGNGKMINRSNISMTQRKKNSYMEIPISFGRTWDSWVITFCIMTMELFLACPLLYHNTVLEGVNREQ